MGCGFHSRRLIIGSWRLEVEVLEWLGAGVFFLCAGVQRERAPLLQDEDLSSPSYYHWGALGPNPVTPGLELCESWGAHFHPQQGTHCGASRAAGVRPRGGCTGRAVSKSTPRSPVSGVSFLFNPRLGTQNLHFPEASLRQFWPMCIPRPACKPWPFSPSPYFLWGFFYYITLREASVSRARTGRQLALRSRTRRYLPCLHSWVVRQTTVSRGVGWAGAKHA